MANYDLTYEGSRVQSILDTGDELRDAGYIFRGEATPSTVPGTPTERVAYIGGPGTYTNFGSSITVGAGCICIFKYTGSAWSNQVINTGLSAAISSEATTRSEADTALSNRLGSTITAENTAADQIGAEATTRSQADTALQNAINAINTKLGEGYIYAGLATPSTNPGTPTGKVFYIAVQAGTYTNFGSAVVTAGLNVIKYNGSAWSVDQVIAIDAEPTQGSDNLVKSGGVLNSIIQNGPALDLSAYNAQGGTLATYADLSAALTALNALPADFKKGGMSMKFVHTSDNKYVQFRYMGTSTDNADFTNVANWQGVDEKPTEGSHNLVESGSVYEKTSEISKEPTTIENDGIVIEDNEGNEVVSVTFNGVNAKNIKNNGIDVVDKDNIKNSLPSISYETDETDMDVEESIDFIHSNNEVISRVKKEGVLAKALLNLQGNLYNSSFLKLLFDKWMCVGDSVTHGFVSDYPNVPGSGQTGYYVKKVSPPRFISLLSGIETVNAGHGGYSAKDWWEKLCQTLDYSDSDVVTIELGYNGGLTDTLNTDVEPYSDYEDYANTNTGCFCKIIEYIQEQNENAYIVLMIGSNFNATLTTVVNKIAERYSLKVINLKDNSYIDLNDNKFHGYLNQQAQQSGTLDKTHFNALGYLFKAALILHELENIVYNDYDTVHVKTEKRWCTSANYLYGYDTTGDVDTIILSDMITGSNRA